MVASTAGGSVACVIASSARNSASSAPSRRSGGTTTKAAPDNKAIDHSEQKLSKPGLTPNRAWPTARFDNPACGTITPLGRPVDPDV